MSMLDRFTKQEFLSNGTWTCPAGVTRILIWGMGGGSGGAGGGRGSVIGSSLLSFGGVGGTGVSLQPYVITVVPNTTYTITIGAGGSGGAGGTSTFGGGGGGAGGNSIFGNSIIEWKGAVRPQVSGSAQILIGNSFWNTSQFSDNSGSTQYAVTPSGGLQGNASTLFGQRGYPGRLGLSAPVNGGGSGTVRGGGGSGMSGETIGGEGQWSDSITNGDAPANSGAGGGGGMGGVNGQNGFAGGAGGSGKIIIMWVE